MPDETPDLPEPERVWENCSHCSGSGRLKPDDRTCPRCGGGGGKWIWVLPN